MLQTTHSLVNMLAQICIICKTLLRTTFEICTVRIKLFFRPPLHEEIPQFTLPVHVIEAFTCIFLSSGARKRRIHHGNENWHRQAKKKSKRQSLNLKLGLSFQQNELLKQNGYQSWPMVTQISNLSLFFSKIVGSFETNFA